MIVSASSPEIGSTVKFAGRLTGSTGTVSVTTIPARSAFANRSSAPSENSPCVVNTHTAVAPCSRAAPRHCEQRAAGHDHVVADDRDLPLDAAGDLRDRCLVVLGPGLVHHGEVALDHLREPDRMLGAPASGATDTTASPEARGRGSGARAAATSCGRAGIVKNPWIWPAWRSMVKTRSARELDHVRDEAPGDGLARQHGPGASRGTTARRP